MNIVRRLARWLLYIAGLAVLFARIRSNPFFDVIRTKVTVALAEDPAPR